MLQVHDIVSTGMSSKDLFSRKILVYHIPIYIFSGQYSGTYRVQLNKFYTQVLANKLLTQIMITKLFQTTNINL